MDDPKFFERPKPKGRVPRTFLMPAHLEVLERNTYGLFRHVEVEVSGSDGRPVREKAGKPIGPIGVFRPCEGQERPDLRTVHPVTGQALDLKRVS